MKTRLVDLLHHKGHEVFQLNHQSTVMEAVREMNRRNIGAVLISEEDDLLGIFSERDVLRRVLGRGLDPAHTRVSKVMTPNPLMVTPETTVEEAMAIMTDRRCRHLPVLDQGTVVGLISIGDLTRSASEVQQEVIDGLKEYIAGPSPH